MEDNIEINEGTAVNSEVDTSATESASVEGEEVNPVDGQTSEEETINEDTKSGDSNEAEEPKVPKWRLDQVIEERNRAREELRNYSASQDNPSDGTSQGQDYSDAPGEEAQIKKVLRDMGFVTREEQEASEREAVARNMFVSEMNRLQQKYDGKDGFPKFNPEEIADYMDDLQSVGQTVTDPETAYRLKYYDQIVDAAVKARKSTPHSESQSTPSGERNDTRNSDLKVASETGDIDSFIKKYVPMPE